jgi:hypothetical protein
VITPDPRDEILRTLTTFVEPGSVFGVRAFRVQNGFQKHTRAGYFDNLEAAVDAISRLDGLAEAVCFTLNPVRADLLSRATNRIERQPQQATADKDILRRAWLFVDCDPERPSGIASTEWEHQAALDRAKAIAK